MTDYTYVKTEKIGHIFRMILNRPERLNAQGAQISWDRRRAWHEAMSDPDVRVVVLSGEGRIFCAGRDIREQAGGAPDIVGADEPVADLGFYSVPETDIPLITAVQGGAWGLGFYMVCASDICVAAEGSRFAMSEIPTGIIGPALFPILNNLPWLPGSEIVIRGHQFDAQRAYELGMISEVVDPPGSLRDRAQELGETIARNSPAAMAATKKALWGALEEGLTDACKQGAKHLVSMWGHPDQTEGPLAFADKREPDWKPLQ